MTMKNQASIHTILRMALVFGAVSLAGCPDDPGEDEAGSSTGSDTGSDTMVTPPAESSSSDGADTINPDSTGSSSAGETETTSGEDPFVFPTEPYDMYTQIDRHGAVEAGTAGILASQGLGLLPGQDVALRDEYNASNPVEDAMLVWLDEITESVVFFHTTFDDDLEALGLVPADADETLAQAGPLILPDTIKYDPAQPTGYPNGRALTDRVVDITLAAVLLDLGTPGQTITTFADIPLNPGENDVPFQDEFPYLAAPHSP
jgi:hypothetical protein